MIKKLITKFFQGLYLQTTFIKSNLFDNLKIAHISDLHFDDTDKFASWLKKSLYNNLYLHKPNILCITGDLVDHENCNYVEAIEYLYHLPVPYIVLSFGNHDEQSINKIMDYILEKKYNYKIKAGVNVSYIINKINFICGPDLNSKYNKPYLINYCFKVNQLNILLSHNPDISICYKDIINKNNPDLILCGHTHGGQIGYADKLKAIFKLINKKILYKWFNINDKDDCTQLQGIIKLSKTKLYISNGLGSHPPGRIFCPPNITYFN